MQALVRGGADVLELGVPFSDPMADGPVIQAACERALAQGMTLRGVLKLVSEFREADQDTPVVLMGYLNPVEAMGYQAFAEAAVAAGVDGVLLVDLSAEEAADTVALLQGAGLETVFLVAPTTSAARLQAVCELANGYIYYVALKGVTGAGNLDPQAVAVQVAQIREHSKLPVAVGFGVNDAASAAAVGAHADAVVVGSALVKQVQESGASAVDDLQALIGGMRKALDQLP